MQRLIKMGTPIVVLALAAVAYAIMQHTGISPSPPAAETPLMSMVYINAQVRPTTLIIHSQGTVEPCAQTTIAAEVTGKICSVVSDFNIGGIFASGDLLLEIDAQDYHERIAQAEALLAQAQLNLSTEQARARQAKQDLQTLSSGKPSKLALRGPQLVHAQAEVRAAKAAVDAARRDLSKTRIFAPFDMMIRRKDVHTEQYVQPGTPLAQIMSVQAAQIRLPVTDDELAQLGLSTWPSRPLQSHQMPVVYLNAKIGDQHHVWQGRIERIEGVFDPKTRVTHVVAQVDDPYGLYHTKQPFPLSIGMFVEARIMGRRITDGIILPPSALDEADDIWIIQEDSTLQRCKVTLAYKDAKRVVIKSGLRPGDRVARNPVGVLCDGMQVSAVWSEIAMATNPEEAP